MNQQNSSPQADYYARIGLYPSRLTGNSAALNDYMAMRRNLYERHLSVPLGLLAGQDVLDLGCGTGEAAAICALMGARLTLVDADARVWGPLDALFTGIGCKDAIAERVTSPAESYLPTGRFALAMAEGFLFTCSNRDEVVARLMSALRPGGLLSVSFPDRLGSFMEFLKKAAFLRICALRGVEDLLSPSAVEAGRELLGQSHAQLPKPRPFDVWLKDCICSPFLDQRYCWSAPELLAASGDGLYYSSSPSIYAADRLGWYKHVAEDSVWNQAAVDGYEARAADFIFGTPVRLAEGTAPGAFALHSREFLERLSAWFLSPAEEMPLPHDDWFRAISESNLDRLTVQNMSKFFAAFASRTASDFARGVGHARTILDLWGKSYHYLVLMRDLRSDG